MWLPVRSDLKSMVLKRLPATEALERLMEKDDSCVPSAMLEKCASLSLSKVSQEILPFPSISWFPEEDEEEEASCASSCSDMSLASSPGIGGLHRSKRLHTLLPLADDVEEPCKRRRIS